ncbi:PKD domain-containing protein [Actinoplanes sp. NPDC051859]|uniref:PKD domain-containing protein n=1 Tax=Actinoplanes sp. NPDC051859 TaxID=3363909 RepID=UPI0037907A37
MTDTPVKGKMLRATKLGPCGDPVVGAGGWPVQVVTKGFVSVEYSAEVDDGEEIDQRDANGDSCVYVPARRRIKFYNVTVTACRVDPELYSLFTGSPIVVDETGTSTGLRVTSAVNQDSAVALELWSGTAQKRCSGSAVNRRPRFGYFLLPQILDGQIGDFTIENGTANFTLTGKAVENPEWGIGPYPVYLRPTGVVALTDPMGEQDLLHLDWTTLPPPAPTAGLVPRPADGTVAANGLKATFTATYAGPAGGYTLDWGDGWVTPGPAVGVTASHDYAEAGTYLVTATDTGSGGQRFLSIAVA